MAVTDTWTQEPTKFNYPEGLAVCDFDRAAQFARAWSSVQRGKGIPGDAPESIRMLVRLALEISALDNETKQALTQKIEGETQDDSA